MAGSDRLRQQPECMFGSRWIDGSWQNEDTKKDTKVFIVIKVSTRQLTFNWKYKRRLNC